MKRFLEMPKNILPFHLLKGLADAFILINKQGLVVCANPAACRLFKKNEKQLQDKYLFDFTVDAPEKIQQFILRWSRNAQAMPSPLTIQISNDETIPCQAWGNVVEKGSENQPALILIKLKIKLETNKGFATLNNKISQLKKEINERLWAEQALRKSQDEITCINEDLERRVEHRTKELKRTNEQLIQSFAQLQQAQEQLVESEKMASLGNLVAGVAHEINTPIGVGVTAASFLQTNVQKYNKLFNDEQLTQKDFEDFMGSTIESTEMILANLQRAVELIQSFKQVAVDQSTDEKRSFNLKEYIEEILQSLQPKIKKTAVSVLLEGPDDIIIDHTPGTFYQIITNLIMNSLIHAFEPAAQGQITITLGYSEDQNILLSYTDNGKGIPPENLKKIFEPFFSTNRQGGGSGLGMHIVYNLVTQKLNGKIKCQSPAGKGAEFQISFPAIKADI